MSKLKTILPQRTFNRKQWEVARAMYLEFCRNEGHDPNWTDLLRYHKAKWNRYAYSAMIAMGFARAFRPSRGGKGG